MKYTKKDLFNVTTLHVLDNYIFLVNLYLISKNLI
jgi:hypothetical protein